MAARKPKERSARKAPPAKKSNDRVNKRPARGYHTFKNGALNVTPKGSEKNIVESNQYSPLLRLPAEIRNIVWKYVLGGKSIRQFVASYYKTVLIPEPSERTNAFALLRVCRQIYVESAHLPFTENSFSVRFLSHSSFRKCFKVFRKHQLRQIKELNIEVVTHDTTFNHFQRCFREAKFNVLPNLRRLRLCLFPDRSNPSGSLEAEKALRMLVERESEGKQYDVVVQSVDIKWHDFRLRWSETSQAE